MSGEPRIVGEVLSRTETSIVLGYEVQNATDGEIVLCNRLYRTRTPDGLYMVDPDVVYVMIEPGPRPNITKRVPERGDDVHVEYPMHPAATLLAPGQRFGEQIRLALPVGPADPYHPVRAPSVAPVPSKGLTVSIGWFDRRTLDDVLVVDVATTAGRLPLVKASDVAQSIVRLDLDVSIPVLAPEPTVSERRTCATCGAVNVGDQELCLQCGSKLPVLTPPAGPGWRATHRVPEGGMPSYTAPGGAPSMPLDGGLPVQVVESYGDWARVVAWTGWVGWVDGRRLIPVAP